jgi:hypothetical protein
MGMLLPKGYCSLGEAAERAAAALFPQEYDQTKISPQEQAKLERHELAKSREKAERERRERVERALRASAANTRSSYDSPSREWARKLPEPLAKVVHVEAPNQDAIDDDEIVSIRQRIEARKTLRAASWDQLRQDMWEGRLAGYCFYRNGQLLKMDASRWLGTWANGAHERPTLEAASLGTFVINESELAALLSGDSANGNGRAAQDSALRATSENAGPEASSKGQPMRPSPSSAHASQVGSGTEARKRSAAGAKPKYDWERIKAFVVSELKEHGVPDPSDPDLPSNEALVTRVLTLCHTERRSEPSVSSVRSYVKRWVDEYKSRF